MKRLFTLIITIFLSLHGHAQVVAIVTHPIAVSGQLSFSPPSIPIASNPNISWGFNIDTTYALGRLIFTDSLACTIPLSNASQIAGKIAVLYRGVCEFGLKALHAQQAGAIGVIIINNQQLMPSVVAAGALGNLVNIPVIMISQADGIRLRSTILTDSCVAFIGQKRGVFQNDLGFSYKDVIRPFVFAISKSQVQNHGEYETKIGAQIINHGTINQSNILLNVKISHLDSTGFRQVAYNKNSSAFSILPSDSHLVNLPDFDSLALGKGEILIEYNIVGPNADDFPFDNNLEQILLITDSLYSLCRLDTLNLHPIVTGGLAYPGGIFEHGVIKYTRNQGDEMLVDKIGFVFLTNPNLNLQNTTVFSKIRKWVDINSDGLIDNSELLLVGQGTYLYQDQNGHRDYRTMDVFDMNTGLLGVPLDTFSTYIISVGMNYIPNIFIGTDTSISYDLSSIAYGKLNTVKFTNGVWSELKKDVPSIVVHTKKPCNNLITTINNNVCLGDTIVLSSADTSAIYYQWFLNGNTIIGANSSSFQPNQNGIYTLLKTTPDSCSSLSNGIQVTFNLFPTAIISTSSPIAICLGDSVLLSANAGAGLTYQWKLNGSNIAGATSPSVAANQSGSYTVEVTNSNNCSKLSQPTTVIVNPLPIATITPATTLNFCLGDSVILNANTGAGLGYQWKLNGNNIIGATTSSLTANQTGNYTVLVTDSNNCSSLSQPIAVTVNPLPPATITVTTPSSICQGDSVPLSANSGTGLTYQWKLNGNNISGATSSIYNATQSGNYVVEVTDGNSCKALSSIQNVMVQPSFTGGPIIGQTNNIIPNQPYIYAVSQNPNRGYAWNVTNGALLAGQGTNTITVLWGNLLQGQVRLIETFELCSDTLELNVGIGQGTSVSEISRNLIQLYPNPNQGLFYLKSPAPLGAIRVTNALGQVVWNGHIENNEYEMNLSHLADGLYQVVVENQVLRVVIRK
jgi:hypothetical protein